MRRNNPLYPPHMHERRERLRHRFSIMASLALLAASVAFALWAVYFAITLPVVYTSYESGYCVRVDDPGGEYTCENMPDKYHHVWRP